MSFRDFELALVEQRLHMADQRDLGNMPVTAAGIRLLVTAGDHDAGKPDPGVHEHVGHRPADSGRIDRELDVAGDARVVHQGSDTADDTAPSGSTGPGRLSESARLGSRERSTWPRSAFDLLSRAQKAKAMRL